MNPVICLLKHVVTLPAQHHTETYHLDDATVVTLARNNIPMRSLGHGGMYEVVWPDSLAWYAAVDGRLVTCLPDGTLVADTLTRPRELRVVTLPSAPAE